MYDMSLNKLIKWQSESRMLWVGGNNTVIYLFIWTFVNERDYFVQDVKYT